MAARQNAVLRENATLAGADLLPLMRQFRQLDRTDLPGSDGAFEKDRPIAGLPFIDLKARLELLLGRPPGDIFEVMGVTDPGRDDWDALAFLAIKQANEFGSPPNPPQTVANQTGSHEPKSTPLSTIVEEQKRLHSEVQSLKRKRKSDDVNEALEQVRSSYRRVKLTGPGVLLAAIDNLVEAANNSDHEKRNYYSKARDKMRSAESNTEDLGLLCASLFGDPDEQKVNTNFYKYQKLAKMAPNLSPEKPAIQGQLGQAFPQPYGFPYGVYPPYSFGRPWFRGGRRGGRHPGPTNSDRSDKICYTCHNKGHFARDCPQNKQD